MKKKVKIILQITMVSAIMFFILLGFAFVGNKITKVHVENEVRKNVRRTKSEN